MKYLNTIIRILKKPFPEQETNFGGLKSIAIISAFVAFFLYIFEPFGISLLESEKFLICLGFGSITFLSKIVYEFLVSQILKLKGELEHWTFGKWILYNLGLILTISLANFLFIRILIFGFIQWNLLPQMVYGTFMIGVIPIAIIGFLSLHIKEKKYRNIAKDINLQIASIPQNHVSDKELLFDIPIKQIKYIEALQNYVTIAYVGANGQLSKSIERASLKNIIEEIAGNSIIKSHRSFLVNRNAIVSTSGNAQGLLLHLSNCDKTIPVSRSYVSIFRGK